MSGQGPRHGPAACPSHGRRGPEVPGGLAALPTGGWGIRSTFGVALGGVGRAPCRGGRCVAAASLSSNSVMQITGKRSMLIYARARVRPQSFSPAPVHSGGVSSGGEVQRLGVSRSRSRSGVVFRTRRDYQRLAAIPTARAADWLQLARGGPRGHASDRAAGRGTRGGYRCLMPCRGCWRGLGHDKPDRSARWVSGTLRSGMSTPGFGG